MHKGWPIKRRAIVLSTPTLVEYEVRYSFLVNFIYIRPTC